jgi:hypothetical protein
MCRQSRELERGHSREAGQVGRAGSIGALHLAGRRPGDEPEAESVPALGMIAGRRCTPMILGMLALTPPEGSRAGWCSGPGRRIAFRDRAATARKSVPPLLECVISMTRLDGNLVLKRSLVGRGPSARRGNLRWPFRALFKSRHAGMAYRQRTWR